MLPPPRQQLKLLNMDVGGGDKADSKRIRGASSSSDSSGLDEPVLEKKERPPEKVILVILNSF